MRKQLFLILIICLFGINLSAQDTENNENSQNFSLSGDLVTNYVWRGLLYSDAVNIQPYMAFTNDKGNFTIGAWGSYGVGNYYSEADFFVNYTVGAFTFSVWDYFTMSQAENNNYFDYSNDSTNHALEGMIVFDGPESFPIQLTASTFFYGNDRDANGDNYYSTYFEAAYPFKWKANNLNVFVGITPWEGLYGSKFTMNNIGISNAREIKVNDKFSIPIKGSLIFNPHLENIYLVLAITLSAND